MSSKPSRPAPTLTPPTDRDRTDDVPAELLRKSAAAYMRKAQNPARVFSPENIAAYAAAALTASLSRIGTKHPTQMTKREMREHVKTAFEIASIMDDEEEKRYSPGTYAEKKEQ